MLLDKGKQLHQHGSCQSCLKPVNHLWHETTLDCWFMACNWKCAESYITETVKLTKEERPK